MKTAATVDLLLGSEIGLWALEQVERRDVGMVVTIDEEIDRAAGRLGFRHRLADLNSCPEFAKSSRALSIHYPRILSESVLGRYEEIFNLHPGYLPWGRGFYPVFWALWERTPAGATLHKMTTQVDKGPIVAQINVPYTEADTGGTLHARVDEAEKELFLRYWTALTHSEALPTFPQTSGGTYHARRQFFELTDSGRWLGLSATELLRLLRAASHPAYGGLNCVLDGTTFSLTLQPRGAD